MYKVSLTPLKCIFKHPNHKLFGEKLGISLEMSSFNNLEELDKGFQELLGGKVFVSSKDPLLPVFQVLESLNVLDLVVLESLELNVIAKSLGNMIKNYKSECFKLELTLGDKLKYVHAIGET